jgi:hypothetical protein
MIARLLLALILSLPAAAAPGLSGKVLTGYQGWFRTPSDGTNSTWQHYSPSPIFTPDHCHIDLWPDVRELPPAARVATPFHHPDGTPAEVFSSTTPAVIQLHFQWMRDYGIDGIFLQRFASTTRSEHLRNPQDAILNQVRSAAASTGRSWTLMYDLSGLTKDAATTVISDWKHLNQQFHLSDASKNPALLRHLDKPLVALWGCGFNDRPPMLDQWRLLIDFFKNHARCSVMLGVPAYWRSLDRDTIADPEFLTIAASADVISPWNVGRFNSPEAAARHASTITKADIAWCRARSITCLPVAFPGFSWHNLSASRNRSQPLNAIPRLGGRFLWEQFRSYRNAGADAVYVAMFDELDEGTAIMKIRQDPPASPAQFVSEPDTPGDHYLWLTGKAAHLFQNPPANSPMPSRSL